MAEPVSAVQATRRTPLSGREGASVGLAPAMTRLSVRGGTEAMLRACHGFGLDPPSGLMQVRAGEDRTAMMLGPDELLLLAPGEHEDLADAVEAALDGEPGSVVDVSHRQVGILVAGEGAATLLNAGCPLDLHPKAFPVGTATRTVLAKADVVLWRTGENSFHLEVWRSFAPYVTSFLREAA